MSVIELSPNGNGDARSAAMRALDETGGNLSTAEIARIAGVKERQARNLKAAWKAGNGNGSGSAAPAPPAAKAATQPAVRQRRDPVRRQSAPVPLIGTKVAVAVVAVVAAVLSYSHIVELAIAADAGWRAYILPLSLDGLVAACTFCLAMDRRQGKFGHPLAWAGILVGLAGSVAANVLAVVPGLVDLQVVAAVLAGFPPVALAVSGHLLFRILGDR